MRDQFSRPIRYLRLSLTDKCNLKCGYCWTPGEGRDAGGERSDAVPFTREEKIRAVRAASRLGVKKARLTGGEPLCCPDLVGIVREMKLIDGIESVHLTTNGTMLEECALELRRAGLDGVNISLDTLDRAKYRELTGCDALGRTLSGIESALSAGIGRVKVNVVLIGGFNDDEICDFVKLSEEMPLDVRFIELMPMTGGGRFGKDARICAKTVLERCPELKALPLENPSSVARLYAVSGAKGRVGLIEPVFSPFCSLCDRLRITSDGFVKPCLHSHDEYPLAGKDEKEMERVIAEAISRKPFSHGDLKDISPEDDGATTGGRSMRRIGG